MATIQLIPELELEENLINQLISGESKWEYRPELNTEEKLWENFRDKLEHNNQDVLNGVPITEKEFQQIKTKLDFSNFYEAAKWLSGENGIAKIEVQREDASLKTMYLRVIKREDIAAGMSSYEVINQFQSRKKDETDRSRRFDVTLLINGLPMVHIELKNRAHPYMDAFRQIKKYLVQGKFTGIFSAVQMFVVSNASETRYIAAATDTKLNEQFLTTWVDENNQPVVDYLAFAEEVLSIPQAHKMVTQYTVIDSKRKSLILLRPYQIHAIEAIKAASKNQESGFVWHTTGSGKTLTSYKVARNLLQIPSIHKTIFIVDRVDLDQQTSASFSSYADNDIIDIDETDDVTDLIGKLVSNDRNKVIVTTIQKLNYLMDRFKGKEHKKNYQKLRQLKLAFIVDECHRAISAKKKKEIEHFFQKSLWYGFTGTPIFKENAKAQVGNLARTTKQLYGRCLHDYTVKDAIHDKAVLGFQVEYQRTFDEEELNDYLVKKDSDLEIDDLTMIEKESYIGRDVFENEKHMLEVIHSIINKSRLKFGFDKGPGKTYNAILTTSSINQAQKYYQLFKKVMAGETTVKISEKTKRVLPDFPKIAITYSISENEEASEFNQEQMKESIQDYNKMYGTRYSLESIRAYNRNVNDRLARKQEKYLFREEQLDLVIVVDRLLTGFDAPCLSTLFIDRSPMQPHELIQAFSRTNRLFDAKKHYGQVVTFQLPETYNEKVTEALILYSNGGEDDVLAPTWEEAQEAFRLAIAELREIAETPEMVNELNKAEKKKFAKAYQKLDRTFSAVQVYTEFDIEKLAQNYQINVEEIEEYHGKYVNVIEELKPDPTDPEKAIDIDIEYELESVNTDEINYEYILLLIQAFVPKSSKEEQQEEPDTEPTVMDSKEITKYLDDLERGNPKLAVLMKDLWFAIQKNPENYRGKQVSTLLEEMIQRTIQSLVKEFSKKWFVNPAELSFVIRNYNPVKEKQIGEAELKHTSNYEAYKEHAEQPVRKLEYWKEVKQAYSEMILRDVLPLQKR